jgi:hypothetical protein
MLESAAMKSSDGTAGGSELERALGAAERVELARLDGPPAIQAFLDAVPYSTEPVYRCPLRVMRERKGHCFDGALFAAAALRRLGHPPRIIDMTAERDEDHLLAVFRQEGLWGAVAKSNFVGLRYREPVYRSLRELVMSYFEAFFNLDREKTLRAYTVPLDLRAFDRRRWEVSDEPLDAVADKLDAIRQVRVMPAHRTAGLALVDERSFRAGLLGADDAGLYRPPPRE